MMFDLDQNLVIVSGVIISSIWILTSYFIIKRRNNIKRRLLYNLIGYLGLFCLINVPSYTRSIESSPSYISSNSTSQRTFKNIHEFLTSDIAQSTDTLIIKAPFDAVADLSLIKEQKIKYLAETTPKGITSIHWPKSVNENESWQLSGEVNSEDVRLSWRTYNGESKEVAISQGKFAFKAKSNSPGFFVHDLIQIIDGDTVINKIPINVHKSPEWGLLMILSYPNPEANYLKNYWVDKGRSFAMRTLISSDKYKTNFVNHPKIDLTNISSSLLNKFNFLYIDIPSWNRLSKEERATVLTANRDNGLALILIPTDQGQSITGINHPAILDSYNQELPNEKTELKTYRFGETWINHKSDSVVLGKWRPSGVGIQYITAIQNSYPLLLSGATTYYQKLWSIILSKSYKNYHQESQLIYPNMMWDDYTYDFNLLSHQPITSSITIDDTVSVELLEAPFLDYNYNIKYKSQQGTHTLHIDQFDQNFTFYVHSPHSWPLIKLNEIEKRINVAASQSSYNDSNQLTQYVPYSPLYWILLTMVGFALLWLDERIYS